MTKNITVEGDLRNKLRHFLIVLCSVFALTLSLQESADALTADDVVAQTGCAMAHCDQAMTDNVHLSPPVSSEVVQVWRDTTVNGSRMGIGCASNSEVVACSFRSTTSKPVEVRTYNRDGNILWSSTAFSSAGVPATPLVDPSGGVISADQNRIIRFGPTGSVVWSKPTAGGFPISSNVTDNGEIVLATYGGPISAYSYTTGDTLAQLRLNATVTYNSRTYSGYFDTLNTPAIKGNRIYVSTQFKYGSYGSTLPIGRLYSLDLVNNQGNYSLQVAWYFSFRAPSGATPTLGSDQEGRTVVHFDGSGLTPGGTLSPQAFAVTDKGTSGELLWTYPMAYKPEASPALDPRGGVWWYAPRRSELLRLSEIDGHLLQRINIDSLITDSGTFTPYSVMTISGSETEPIMLVTASTSYYSRAYVTAIDLTVDSGSLLWKFRIDQGRGINGVPMGQFPIVMNSANKPVVVFTTYGNGIWALTSAE